MLGSEQIKSIPIQDAQTTAGWLESFDFLIGELSRDLFSIQNIDYPGELEPTDGHSWGSIFITASQVMFSRISDCFVNFQVYFQAKA